MITVCSKVRCYEVNDEEVKLRSDASVEVQSHWNIGRWVVLEVGGMRVTVNAADLRAAIANATNSGVR